ncbi:hypothetical protein GGX14DRAFT_344444 [Mycena pura]|uniref:Uncharacterized protein n=1 Tax=Mycena pura TaxID=153505 RepID=A0AAD7E661_9AGAR|nr:hypothetical protein GGX14DRAFT_344444 [Mycena pura]
MGLGQQQPVESLEERHEQLAQELEQLYIAALEKDRFGELEETDEVIIEADDEDGDVCFDPDLGERSDYFPYPNKTVMLLDIMDNLPRCRFTGAQLAVILHFAKKLGGANVPTLKSFRNTQKRLQSTCGSEPVKITSGMGNILYMNDIRESLARDFANPAVAPHLQLYPEITKDGPVSETWQAARWLEYDPSQLTPMFSVANKRFWVNEIAQLKDKSFVLPLAWIKQNGVLTSPSSVVTRLPDGRWSLTGTYKHVDVTELDLDFLDIVATYGSEFVWTDGSAPPVMPNQMRKLVDDDEDLYVVMTSPWADDVSGNKSKQYNKHMNMYAQNGCLPGRLLQQEFHMHFISSSPHASSAEQFAAFRDHVKATENDPVRCFNAGTGCKCRFIIRAPGLPADNPQQSEEASHMGANANYPCRKCHWGGTTVEKETDVIYHKCHEPGDTRSADEIRIALREQLRLATEGDAKAVEMQQRATGTKDKITQYWIERALVRVKEIHEAEPGCTVSEVAGRVQTWLDEQPGDKMNPLLDITGLDPSQDTPVELLHTVLLGVVKYIWHFMNTSKWSDADRHLLAIRLQSTDISGLSVPPLRASYMMQYRNNLIGKHFKTLMQTLGFHAHDIATLEQFVLIKAAGDLGARLWIPVIDNMDQYIAQLKIAIANLLDAFDAVDPLRIIVKIKLHLLAHIPDDIRRFGPAIRFSTEVHEAYNAVFRLCSINSNHLAPSRDISRKFASMDRTKHLLSGGFFWEPTMDRWVQPGSAVLAVLRDDPVFQRHLGWVPVDHIEAGKIRKVAQKKQKPLEWNTTRASQYWDLGAPPSAVSPWRLGKAVTAANGDEASQLSWVWALNQEKWIFGRVAEILEGSQSLVTLERFVLGEQLHPDFDWPIARRPRGTDITEKSIKSHVVVESKSIQFAFSVQHDCRKGKCLPAVVGKQRQEREETDLDRKLITHSDDDHFIINMAGLHNFDRLCRVLPKAFTMLKPLHNNRAAFHKQVSSRAQMMRTQKRQRTSEKRRATAAAKKKEAERMAAEAGKAAAAAAKAAEEAEEAARQAEEDGEIDEEDPGQEEKETEWGNLELSRENPTCEDPEDDTEPEPEGAEEIPPRRVTRSQGKLKRREA